MRQKVGPHADNVVRGVQARSRSPRPRPQLDFASPKRGISADTALRLSRFFGTTDRFWLNMQSRFELEVERDRLADALNQIEPLATA